VPLLAILVSVVRASRRFGIADHTITTTVNVTRFASIRAAIPIGYPAVGLICPTICRITLLNIQVQWSLAVVSRTIGYIARMTRVALGERFTGFALSLQRLEILLEPRP
jgi:hypothetical protein